MRGYQPNTTILMDVKKHLVFPLPFSVLAASHALVAREFSKKGCPTSMRGELWCQMMGVEVDEVVGSGVR